MAVPAVTLAPGVGNHGPWRREAGGGHGGALQFTVHVYVTQDNLTGSGVINGFVGDGPLQGTQVDGEYQVIYPCGIINSQTGGALFDNTCFQGNLVIRPGSAD